MSINDAYFIAVGLAYKMGCMERRTITLRPGDWQRLQALDPGGASNVSAAVRWLLDRHTHKPTTR